MISLLQKYVYNTMKKDLSMLHKAILFEWKENVFTVDGRVDVKIGRTHREFN